MPMILVTGGAGFIGSNLVAALAERGHADITVCDVLDDPAKIANLAKHPVEEIVPPDRMLEWLDGAGDTVAAVFHLGAISSTTETDMDRLIDNNLGVSLDLWRWCSVHRRPFIYASSAATYGAGENGFDDDNDPVALAHLRPLNEYGLSKHMFDLNAVQLARAGYHPPQWAGLKFFNVYGPNEQHKGGQRSVAIQLYEQITAADRVRLFRSHHPDYEDGGQQRDFIWVGDCVDMMLWLLDNPAISGIFNCGTGHARSFRDLAEACFAAMDREPKIDFIDTPENIRSNYQYFTEANLQRIRQVGYAKPFTTLEDGAASYIRDYLATNDPHR